jgi:uncharacterized protein YbcC (UPF0753/DUF2309 family)
MAAPTAAPARAPTTTPVATVVPIDDSRTRLVAVLAQDRVVARLASNRWIHLACLDPDGSRLLTYNGGAFDEHEVEERLQVIRGDSQAYYEGRSGCLPFVRLEPEREVAGQS